MRRLFCLMASIALAAPALARGAAQDSATQSGAALYGARCASCHDNGAASRVPSRTVIAALPAERIVQALTTGVMQVQGETLSDAQRRAIAAFLSTATSRPSGSVTGPTCAPASSSSPIAAASWNGWGVTLANDRFQRTPGLTLDEVPKLRLKWAFGFEGETSAATQPTIVGDRVFIGSASGQVYALGLTDGCLEWTFKADAGVRAAVTLGGSAPNQTAYVADMRATVYALDARTAKVRWQRRVEEHRSSRVTGTPVLFEGRLYVPVSSGEEGVGAQPGYECCTFRGSVVALDAATGEVIWKTYLIQDEPKPNGRNKAGTQLWAPSGAAVWSSPTIDQSSRVLYIATGDAYTHPAAPTTDAVIALDLSSGEIKWTRQLLAGDAWNMACGSLDPTNCPDNAGPDHDFGQPPILATLPSNQRVLAIAQKSALAFGLDPDDGGRVLWTTRIGRGGMIGGAEWGSASDGTHIYVPLSDLTFKNPEVRGRGGLEPGTGGGLFAIRLADGIQTWSAKPPPCGVGCSPAQSAPASLMPGALFSGSLDGHLRAFATTDGRMLWEFDTAREFETVNGVKANGGSIDVGGPAIASGMVLTTSGYGTWGGKRGNVLLAFGVQ